MVNKEPSRIAVERLARLCQELRVEGDGAPLSQGQVAERMGIDQGYLSRLLRKERGGIGFRQLSKIAEAIGMDPAYFTTRDEPISYREYLRNGRKADLAHPSFGAFLSSPMADGISREHEDELRSERPRWGDPGFEYYVHRYASLKARDAYREAQRAGGGDPRWTAALDREQARQPMDATLMRKLKAFQHDVPLEDVPDIDVYARAMRKVVERMLGIAPPPELASADRPKSLKG